MNIKIHWDVIAQNTRVIKNLTWNLSLNTKLEKPYRQKYYKHVISVKSYVIACT